MTYEYKVVPAPTRGRRAKGVKTPADRFARALEDAINEFAAEGWEYQRTDTLPSEERQGLTGRTTVYQNMLVFRRALETAAQTAEQTDRAPTPPEPPKAPKVRETPALTEHRPDPAPQTAADTSADAQDTPQRAALRNLIEEELAAARAPKLPSAGAAQELSAPRTGPVLTASRKDVAAE